MKVLIPTQVCDTHAIAVMLALQQKGHQAIRWFVADFPDMQTATVELGGSSQPHMTWDGRDFSEDLADIDIVWFRRPTLPTAPLNIHDDDIDQATIENSVFFHSIWSLLSDQVAWVNPFAARKLARSKLYQLRAAQRNGFAIPKTLVSNNPVHIRTFLQGKQKIFKPFRVAEWQSGDGTALLQTTQISADAHFSDIALQSTAGIYQEQIEKSYELRINYFGGSIIAVKLDSQLDKRSALDWRAIAPELLVPNLVELPQAISNQCHALMNNLGLVFGCIDLMVTPEGEYCFLEVNEMGQFLWIERSNPEIRLLDAFCDFLLKYSNQNSIAAQRPVSYPAIAESPEFAHILKDDETKHRRRNPALGLAEWYI